MSYTLNQSSKTSQPDHFIVFDTEAYPEEKFINKVTVSHNLNPEFILINQHILSFGYAFYFELINGEYKKTDELFFSRKIENIQEYNTKYYTNYIQANSVFTDFFLRKIKKGTTLYLFAHNISYDVRHIIDEKLIKSADFKLKIGISDNVFIYKYGKKNFDICFLSTTNYFRTSLKELGKIFNLEKLEFEMNDEGIKEIKDISDRAKFYCFRDTEIVGHVVINLINFTKDRCKFSYTIASTAFNIFRNPKYYDGNIIIHHNPEIEFFERLSYYGGRTECFKIGLFENIYKLDINSMYPNVMLDNYYPVEFIQKIDKGNKKILNELLQSKEYLIIANITVNLKESKIPYRDEIHEKLLYPVGKFSSFLCQPEIELLNDDEIFDVKEILIYKKAKLFYKFVTEYYNLRLDYKNGNKEKGIDKNDVMQYFCKTTLTSSYGKFAQKTKKEVKNPDYNNYIYNGYIDIFDDEINKLHKLKFIHGECFEISDEESSRNTFIPISSFVTSYSRVLLYKLITLIKPYLIYCDTDSLLCTLKGFEILMTLGWINKDALGKLKKEDFLLEFDCRNLKDYSSKNQDLVIEHKIKGVKKDSVKKAIENNEDISKKNVWKIKRFLGYNESLRYFNLIVGDIEEIKHLKRTYEKGLVDKNGVVHPFYINEIDELFEGEQKLLCQYDKKK